uniref:Uncharacterized protein n=1 Tax=Parascaris univalens TaxID=6257 RepID=A0A915CBZ9_PARUN
MYVISELSAANGPAAPYAFLGSCLSFNVPILVTWNGPQGSLIFFVSCKPGSSSVYDALFSSYILCVTQVFLRSHSRLLFPTFTSRHNYCDLLLPISVYSYCSFSSICRPTFKSEFVLLKKVIQNFRYVTPFCNIQRTFSNLPDEMKE